MKFVWHFSTPCSKSFVLNHVAILTIPNHWFAKIYFCINFLVIQGPVVAIVRLPMRLYFHFATKKVLDHSRAGWQNHHVQFSGTQVTVQHLVEGMTSAFITMPTVTLIRSQALATLTLFQVEYETSTKSWLGLTTSHLMRWRCFILTESPRQDVAIKLYLLDVSVTLYNLYISGMLMAEFPKRLVWKVHVAWLWWKIILSCYFWCFVIFFIFVQVKIVIFNSTLIRQQLWIADTRDGPAVLRGSQWAGGFYG